MKNLLTILALFAGTALAAQQKGASPLSSQQGNFTGATRAVVIGISDYREPLIPDLRFADRDAEAFANWLRSPSGYALPDSNIRFLVNAQATTAQMIMAMDWLIETSRPGDRAFIYFSGHGDVERVTKFYLGFLLTYDSPPAVYGAGAFSLQYLQAILSTLSENEVQVFMITDACRAGKLAGSEVHGAQATATRLSQQFANEIKVLSCQPDEFSLEGEQWGGGRGCFSYHLEDALYGFADVDEDERVDLLELRRYLEDHVSAEADPQSQVPMVSGPMKTKVTSIRAGEVAARKAAKGRRPTPFLATENKGIENLLPAKTDSSIRRLYLQFLVAVDSGFLLQPAGRCANDYLVALLEKPEMAPLYGSIKRTLAAALIEEGQRVINRVMQTDPQILDNIWAAKVNYDHLPAYFHRAAEILGSSHYVYKDLKIKELYFQALTIRPENYPERDGIWQSQEKRRLLNQAVAIDSTMAIIFEALGRSYRYLGFNPEALSYYRKALELAPNWALIHYQLGVFTPPSEPRSSILYYQKAIELDSSFLLPYHWIGDAYEALGDVDSASWWWQRSTEKFIRKFQKDSASITAYECAVVGNTLWRLRNYEQAKAYLLLGERVSSGKYVPVYGVLECVYTDLFEFENAIRADEKACNLLNIKDNAGTRGMIYFNFLYDKVKALEAYAKAPDGAEFMQVQTRYLLDVPGAFAKAKKAMLDPYAEGFGLLAFYAGEAALQMGMADTAAYYYRLILEKSTIQFKRNTIYFPDYLYAALAYDRLGNRSSALQIIEKAKNALQGDPWMYFNLARFYANTQDPEAAIEALYKAIELKWQPNPLMWLEGTLCDHLLNPIRETEAYKQLVRKHFPKYYNIATRIPGKN